MMCALTDTRVEIGNDGSQGDDQKLEVLAPVRPVLRVERRVGGLWPEHLCAVRCKLEARGDGFAQFDLRFPVEYSISRDIVSRVWFMVQRVGIHTQDR